MGVVGFFVNTFPVNKKVMRAHAYRLMARRVRLPAAMLLPSSQRPHNIRLPPPLTRGEEYGHAYLHLQHTITTVRNGDLDMGHSCVSRVNMLEYLLPPTPTRLP